MKNQGESIRNVRRDSLIKINFVKILKVVTLIFCVVAFVLNVLSSIENYMNDATVQQSSTQLDRTRLPLPAFLICNGVGYKDSEVELPWEEKDYFNLTRDPDDFDVKVITNEEHDPPLDPNDYTLRVWNTVYDGRCLSIEFKHWVINDGT